MSNSIQNNKCDLNQSQLEEIAKKRNSDILEKSTIVVMSRLGSEKEKIVSGNNFFPVLPIS